jgi:hypothetical protein
VKLLVRHTFDCTPARFWEMYWSDSFDQLLMRDATVDREVLEERQENGQTVRRVRFTPHADLPAAAASIVGAKKLVYEQENRFDPAKGVLTWRVVPTILPGKLDAKGKFSVSAKGSGCEQVVDGDITVNVFLVGAKIEAAVIAEVEKSYVKTAETARAWLRQHGA